MSDDTVSPKRPRVIETGAYAGSSRSGCSPIPVAAVDLTTRGMRPNKTVGTASGVDCSLIDCNRRMVLVKSDEHHPSPSGR